MRAHSSCVFCFQAEDGIRGIGVTGVQTCALPILLPSVRWYFRRKVRRVMDEISTRFKIELPEFKLTQRRALLDRLTTDPRVLAAVQQQVVESGVPRDVLIQRVNRSASEIVPAFNAYVYFRVGYWLAKTFAQMAYRVRLGYTDEAALA